MILSTSRFQTESLSVDLKDNGDLTMSTVVSSNNAPVMDLCQIERMNGSNGMSDKRMFQKIGRVPYTVVLKAKQMGYNMDDTDDIQRFLESNPEFMTVQSLRHVGERHRIIVR